jgi:ABC-type Mn2+/Zn2+ transport system permease subunit
MTIISVEHNLRLLLKTQRLYITFQEAEGISALPGNLPRNILTLKTRRIEMLNYIFMQNAIFVSFCIAILCPCIGVLLVLRRYSMIGDTLAHASLAGVTLGLAFGQNPVLGAFIFTSICGALIEFLRNYFKKYTDLILSIVLALSVGVAITIISSGKLHVNANSINVGRHT